MGRISNWLLLCCLLVAGPVEAAQSDCPPHEPGVLPWMPDGMVKGDLFAWVFLELDKNAQPKRCLMGENNIHDPDMRFFACRAMKEDWHLVTPEEERSLASTTVKRRFVIPGPNRVKEIREAKKAFFAGHPDLRPECYPDD